MLNPALSFAALATVAVATPAQSAAQATAPAAQSVPTRAALIKNVDANFKAIDTNGDGSLSVAELTAAELKGIQQRLAAQFNKLDTNKDGQLSRAEFMAAAGSPNGAPLLGQLDKNKDGKVTADEYRAPIVGRFDALDTNHDGTLSPTERAAAQAKKK